MAYNVLYVSYDFDRRDIMVLISNSLYSYDDKLVRISELSNVMLDRNNTIDDILNEI